MAAIEAPEIDSTRRPPALIVSPRPVPLTITVLPERSSRNEVAVRVLPNNPSVASSTWNAKYAAEAVPAGTLTV